MIHIDNGPLKQKHQQEVPKEPQQYALVAHTMPNAHPLLTPLGMLHVLVKHFNVAPAESLVLIDRAMGSGKTVVRIGTRDMMETMLRCAEGCGCGHVTDSPDYQFTVEPN